MPAGNFGFRHIVTKGSPMEMRSEPYTGMTFASSMRGWRYDRINEYVLIGAVFGGFILSDLLRREDIAWYVPLVMVITWTSLSWLTHNRSKRKVFRSRVTVCEDGLDAVDAGEAAFIPLGAVQGIRIERSPSGHRRKVEIRVYGGVLLTLLEPEEGELLEQWTREVAQPAGIKVAVKVRPMLNAEPLWTFLLLLAATLAIHAAMDRGWI